ncbi:MAG: hypothetical protein QW035_01510 [Candidatus Anstonellales archaeon]
MERKLHWQIYIAALIVTIAIFGFGTYVGSFMAQQAASVAERQLIEARQDLMEIELMLFLDSSYAYCPYYIEQFESIGSKREMLGNQIESLEKRGEDPGSLKEEYFLFEAFNFAIGQRIAGMCQHEVKQALYFYPKSCQECKSIAEALGRLRESKGYYVYSFDGDSKLSLVMSMKKQYGIVSLPAVVCNGRTMQGAALNAESIAEGC